VQHHGEDGAGQELTEPRRGRPVRGVGAGRRGDDRRGDRREGEQRADEHEPTAVGPAQDDDQRKWPHPVELLLDRQRPVVVER
jgi:hypothetical protein